MNTLDVLYYIGKHNESIESFSFHTFPSQKLIQHQLSIWRTIEQKHFDKAIRIRNMLKLPFWDSVMITTFNNSYFSENLLKAALYHNHSNSIFHLATEEIINSPLLNSSNQRVAVCSRVLMKDKRIMHIPMFDFHIPISDVNLNIVECVCNILKLGPGFILNSGESYHFISLSIVSWDELYALLSKAIRFSPIIDKTWVSHQLEEKACSLRVDKKNDRTTKVIKMIR